MSKPIINELMRLWNQGERGKSCVRALANMDLYPNQPSFPVDCERLLPHDSHIVALLAVGGYKRAGADRGYAYEQILRLAAIAHYIVTEGHEPNTTHDDGFPTAAGASSLHPDLELLGVGTELKTTDGAEFGHFKSCCYVTRRGPCLAYWAPVESTAPASTYVKMGAAWTQAQFAKIRCKIDEHWDDGWTERMCAAVRDEAARDRQGLSWNIEEVMPSRTVREGMMKRATDLGIRGVDLDGVLMFSGLLDPHVDTEHITDGGARTGRRNLTKVQHYYKAVKQDLLQTFMDQAAADRAHRLQEINNRRSGGALLTQRELVASDNKVGREYAKVEAVGQTKADCFMSDHVYFSNAPTREFKAAMNKIAGVRFEFSMPIEPWEVASAYGVKKCSFIQVGGAGLYSCGRPLPEEGARPAIPSFADALNEGAALSGRGAGKLRFRVKETGTVFHGMLFDCAFTGLRLAKSRINLDNGASRGLFLEEYVEKPRKSGQLVVTLEGGPLLIARRGASVEVARRARRMLTRLVDDVCSKGPRGGAGEVSPGTPGLVGTLLRLISPRAAAPSATSTAPAPRARTRTSGSS